MTHCIGCTLPVEPGALRCARCLEAHQLAESRYDEPGPTLTQALAALGYSHVAAPPGRQGRLVLGRKGEPAIGVLTSAQGWDFVRSHETTPIGHAAWLAAHEAAR